MGGGGFPIPPAPGTGLIGDIFLIGNGGLRCTYERQGSLFVQVSRVKGCAGAVGCDAEVITAVEVFVGGVPANTEQMGLKVAQLSKGHVPLSGWCR